MKTDSIFLKGASHLVCEDYAIARTTPDGDAYAIVADGCSSGYRSDVAARIMAMMAEKLLQEDLRFFMEASPLTVNHIFLEHLKIVWEHELRSMFDDPMTLLATLVVLMTRNGQARVMMFGDGGVFFHAASGWTSHVVSFSQSAPRYPAYFFDEKLTRRYDEMFKDQLMTYAFGPSKIAQRQKNVTDPSVAFGYVSDLSLEVIDTVIVSSDGMGTFNDSPNDESLPQGAIGELIDIKTYTGDFLRRSVLFSTEKLAKRGILHDDDIGLAGIHV